MTADDLPAKVVHYTPRCVRWMNAQGIEYTDNYGTVCVIDFATCRANWARHVNASSEWATTTLRADQTLCVGWRDWFDPAPYFEFFAEPRTRFVFAQPRYLLGQRLRFLEARGRRRFNAFQHALRATGWSTFDLG